MPRTTVRGTCEIVLPVEGAPCAGPGATGPRPGAVDATTAR